jgi:parallel beta-helix repeat protein
MRYFLFTIFFSLVFSSYEKNIQTMLILAEPGDTIHLGEGSFSIKGSLSMEGKGNIVISGNGMSKTILSFRNQTDGAEGLRVNNCTNITLVDFTIQDSKGDAIKIQDVDGIIFRRVKAEWTNGPSPENGAYGLYPVLCQNVLIEYSIAIGASDAGIYVGQSQNIIVRNSEAYHNVAGIEIENSIHADVYENYAHHNTGGILVFDLPDLVQKEGGHIRVYNNRSEYNNLDNFAPPGNIVGNVPAGTGIMILAAQNVEIFDNQIIENKTVGTAIVSYFITEEPMSDSLYNPYTSSISIHDNTYKRSKQIPSLGHEIGQLLFAKFWRDVPDIVYDGMPDPQFVDSDGNILDGYNLCIQNNGDAEFVNLEIDKHFETWYSPFITKFSQDRTPFDCELNALTQTIITAK